MRRPEGSATKIETGQTSSSFFAISTVALYHLTFSINSLAHRVGSRRFEPTRKTPMTADLDPRTRTEAE